jgi:competence protein ComEA
VEQQSTPWRVFDAPPVVDGHTPTAAAAGLAPSGPAASALASPRVALAALVAALGVGALAVLIALGHSGDGFVTGPQVIDVALGSADPLVNGGQIIVDVVGAVVRPGVYRLPIGSRVGDAVTAAGGFGPRVDADAIGAALNLAAPLKDGDQVRIPSRDDATLLKGGAGGAAGTGGSGAKLVNLNTATDAELDALPGIGPVTAGKIIESRTQTPFNTVDELRSRGLVGQKTFDQIKAFLTVG